MEKTLSPKSQEILDMAVIHRDRCLLIELYLGRDAAESFHIKFKGDPGSEDATKEYGRLIAGASN